MTESLDQLAKELYEERCKGWGRWKDAAPDDTTAWLNVARFVSRRIVEAQREAFRQGALHKCGCKNMAEAHAHNAEILEAAERRYPAEDAPPRVLDIEKFLPQDGWPETLRKLGLLADAVNQLRSDALRAPKT